MLPWNYTKNTNFPKNKQNINMQNQINRRHNVWQNNRATSQRHMQGTLQNYEDQFNKVQLEKIKRAIKENRVEFVNGGAQLIENKEGVNVNNGQGQINNTMEKEPIKDTIKEADINGYPLNKLPEFIQNERNASIFYKYLASIANKEENSKILDNLSKESLKRFNSLNSIYETSCGKKYEVKKSKINNTIKFKEGVSWAIAVENKGLIEMIDVYESLDTEQYCRKISAIMYRKTCDISFLQLVLSSIKGIFS